MGSVLLLYCPPLLDILPMYVTFLFFTPHDAVGGGALGMEMDSWPPAGWCGCWRSLACATWCTTGSSTSPTCNIPLQETGAFNLFAWQGALDCRPVAGRQIGHSDRDLPAGSGLAGGSRGARLRVLHRRPVRLARSAPHLSRPLGCKLDKWQIGPLRVLNLVAFTTVVYWARKYLTKLVPIEPFLTLGKASLKVFCAHLFFVFAGLALLYGDMNQDGLDQLHGIPAIALLAITFTCLHHRGRERSEKEACRAGPRKTRS